MSLKSLAVAINVQYDLIKIIVIVSCTALQDFGASLFTKESNIFQKFLSGRASVGASDEETNVLHTAQCAWDVPG